MTVRIVTGFVPLPGHPRSEKQYRALAKKAFEDVHSEIAVFEGPLENCWLHCWLEENAGKGKKRDVHWPTADNPKKNSLGYMCIQAQKSQWIADATDLFNDDVFVWIDYGIAHIGVTA